MLREFRAHQDILRNFIYIFDIFAHALMCGPDKSYFWLLARSPRLDDDLKQRLVGKAAPLGFNTKNLIYVQQDN